MPVCGTDRVNDNSNYHDGSCKKEKQPTKTLTESQDYSAGVTKIT